MEASLRKMIVVKGEIVPANGCNFEGLEGGCLRRRIMTPNRKRA